MARTPKTLLPALLVALVGTPAALGQTVPEPGPGLGAAEAAAYLDELAPTNAALVYYQHLLTVPDSTLQAYVHFNADPDDDDTYGQSREDAERAMADAQETLDNLAWASRLPVCDFGVQYQQGWAALLPHLGKLRSFARVLEADARRQFAAGDPDKAAERLATICNMSRQIVDREPVLITSLVSIAITTFAHTAVLEAIESGQLTDAGRDMLIESLKQFEGDDPFKVRECVKMEAVVSLGWLAKTFPDGGAGTELKEMGFLYDDTSAQTIRKLNDMNGPEFLAEAERMLEFFRRSLDAWNEPDAVAQMDQLGAVVGVGGFGELGKAFAPAFGKARASDLRGQAMLEETLAALTAYEHREPDAAATDAGSDR